ncbi:MAG: DNRLRE domain-containing protein [Flavobacteriaceae bacterium]
MNFKKVTLIVLAFSLFMACGTTESKVLFFKPEANSGKDTAIYEGSASKNFSTLDKIHMLSLSSNDSVKSNVRSLLRIGFSTLPKEAVIDSAFLNLYTIDPGHFGQKNSFTATPIKEVWINTEVNWNTQPAVYDSQKIIVPAPSNAKQDYKINVTDFVSAVHSKKQQNNGLMLKLEDEKKSYKGVRFHSSNSKSLEKQPQLEVYYH